MKAPFDLFLATLAPLLEFPSLHPDSNHACLIAMRETGLELLFTWDDQLVPQTILLSTSLFSIPPGYQEQVYETCLKGNSLIDEILSVHPSEEVVYLHIRIPPSIPQKDLKTLLDRFQQAAFKWKGKLEGLKPDPLPQPLFSTKLKSTKRTH